MSAKTIMPEELEEPGTQQIESGQVITGRTSLAAITRRTRKAQGIAQRSFLIVPPVLLALVILLSWYLGTTIGHIPSFILPAPDAVFAALGDGLSSGLFLSNALVTIQESLVGFALAVLIGLPLGYGIAKWRLFAITMQPYLAAGQAIPAIVIAPVLYLIFGYGTVPIIILCALIVLFPMVITTALGFQTIDRALIDAARVEGASGWPMLARIEFPLALPAILAALRTGLTLSVTGALVGEFVSQGSQGLGALVLVSMDQFNVPLNFATLIVLGALAALYYCASWLLVKLANAIY
ncbi:MAG TPA: ABC transporter permease [Ktedonobacteraceae bacterium]|nr:ABC transporter permease [Ktedonobacteraceae bacterium]